MRKLFSLKPVTIPDSTIFAAQNGDIKAQESVIRDCIGLTAGLIKRFGQSLNTYSADELTHIGMLVTLDCLSGFNPKNGTPFTAYVFSAIRNKFITMIDRQKRYITMRYLGKFASHILPKGDWKHIFTKDDDHIMYMLPNTIALCIYSDARIEEFAVFKMDEDFVMEPKHIEEFCSAITGFKKDIEAQTIYDIVEPSIPTEPPLA